MSNEIEDILLGAGFAEEDVKLGQKLTRRGLESHLNLVNNIRSCERCALSLDCYGQRDAPIVVTDRVIGTGPWNSPLMIIGEMPGEHEAKYQTPYVGAEGQLLTMILAKAGVDRNAIYMTYAVKCAGTREPSKEELTLCRRHIEAEIEAVNPRMILTLGEYAMKMVNPQAATVQNARGEIWGKKDKFQVVHTHNMKALINGGPDQQRYKTEVWQDVSLAVTSVKEERPNYVYDRVGLNDI